MNNEQKTINAEEVVHIIDPSPEIIEKAESYMKMLREILSDATITLIGSLAVPVCLKDEMDVLVELEPGHDIALVQEKIKKETGDMFHIGPIKDGEEGFMRSKKKYGVRCELHIIHKGDSRGGRYRELVSKLQSNPGLAREYDAFKRSLSGLPLEVYKKEKLRFLREHHLIN